MAPEAPPSADVWLTEAVVDDVLVGKPPRNAAEATTAASAIHRILDMRRG
jgi:hypothetical protein